MQRNFSRLLKRWEPRRNIGSDPDVVYLIGCRVNTKLLKILNGRLKVV